MNFINAIFLVQLNINISDRLQLTTWNFEEHFQTKKRKRKV